MPCNATDLQAWPVLGVTSARDALQSVGHARSRVMRTKSDHGMISRLLAVAVQRVASAERISMFGDVEDV